MINSLNTRFVYIKEKQYKIGSPKIIEQSIFEFRNRNLKNKFIPAPNNGNRDYPF